jgi:hypothetical protein
MMMPPTADLADHLRTLRTLSEARATYRVREDMMRPSRRDISGSTAR